MLPIITLSAIDRGASVSVAALIAALIGIGSILTNIPSGALATRIGERASMVVAAAVSAFGLLLCILPFGLWIYGSGVFLIGCASSVFSLARQSYLTEMVPVAMRARALSTLGGSMRVGIFVGPFLGAAVMHFFGIASAYVVALVAVLGSGAIAYGVPDLVSRESDRTPGAPATTIGMMRRYWRLFLTLGTGILLLSAIRQTRQIVIPLWAHHIGLSSAAASMIYGIAGAIDAATFYPAGKVMDRYGRRAVAVPCTLLMGVSFLLMPLTHGFTTLILVSLLMGVSNGIGSGIVMTLGADVSPAAGRPTFLGLWRELADAGAGVGPVILSFVTAVWSLGGGIVVSGAIGFAAAAALWRWIPRRPRSIAQDAPTPAQYAPEG
jgi:MFS family permease